MDFCSISSSSAKVERYDSDSSLRDKYFVPCTQQKIEPIKKICEENLHLESFFRQKCKIPFCGRYRMCSPCSAVRTAKKLVTSLEKKDDTHRDRPGGSLKNLTSILVRQF